MTNKSMISVTGIGKDSHAFRKPVGKFLGQKLGGFYLDICPELEGNSDSDVILHALTNAVSSVSGVNILGARSDDLCLKQGITNSAVYLKEALDSLNEKKIIHASISLECKIPYLASHIENIKNSIASILKIDVIDVGLTATSGENLTAFGRGQGIEAIALISILKPI